MGSVRSERLKARSAHAHGIPEGRGRGEGTRARARPAMSVPAAPLPASHLRANHGRPHVRAWVHGASCARERRVRCYISRRFDVCGAGAFRTRRGKLGRLRELNWRALSS